MGAWQITIKDLQLILRDKGALFTLLALPIVVIAILGMSTGKLLTGDDKMKLVRVAIVDESQGEISAQVIRSLSGIGGLKVDVVPDRETAKADLQNGVSSVVVILGSDFENRIDALTPADVIDPEHGKLAQGLEALDIEVQSGTEFVGVAELVEYVVLAAVLRSVAPEVIKHNRLFARMMERMIARHAAEQKEEATTERPAPRPISDDIYETLVPAFLVMFAFFLVNIMASSFISERKLGTLRRLQMSRVSPVQLLFGKTLPFLLVSVVQSVLLFLAGKAMFGMSLGPRPAMLLPVIFATSVAATGLGLLLATIVRTESQVSSYSTFLVVVLAGISGCYMPRAWLPELMKTISLGTPHAWALIAYQELLTRDTPDLEIVGRCCAVLVAMGAVYFVVGALRFRLAA